MARSPGSIYAFPANIQPQPADLPRQLTPTMFNNPPHLSSLQRWMQSVITHPEGVSRGIDAQPARQQIEITAADVEQVVCRSQALTAIQRLEIYHNAYFARLMECLRETFPALVSATGPEVFDQFALGYLQAYPSTSYTLGHLADKFMQYLAQTRPDTEPHQAGVVDWPDFLIDLATLEWTIEQVFDGPGVEDQPLLDADRLLAIAPDQWPQVRLVPVPCLRLLDFRYPVNDYFTEFRQQRQEADQAWQPSLPQPRPQYVAVTRRDYVVQRHELEATEFDLLAPLVAGQAIGRAIEALAAAANQPLDALAVQLRRWFTRWTAHGFFASVELPRGENDPPPPSDTPL